MPDGDTLALLREALHLFNDRPSFGLRNDPRTTSYRLASRIDVHLAKLAEAARHPAIPLARALWSDDDHVQVDEGENQISIGDNGVWVRAWLLVDNDELPGSCPT